MFNQLSPQPVSCSVLETHPANPSLTQHVDMCLLPPQKWIPKHKLQSTEMAVPDLLSLDFYIVGVGDQVFHSIYWHFIFPT